MSQSARTSITCGWILLVLGALVFVCGLCSIGSPVVVGPGFGSWDSGGWDSGSSGWDWGGSDSGSWDSGGWDSGGFNSGSWDSGGFELGRLGLGRIRQRIVVGRQCSWC